ncbi:hypothetical protein HHK36_009341 [Tetracentron sinense]|uniref:Uncharacterized protein n=1 Tax=Tetracentron sinense TaxID=13715 RepID=A0A834ZD85_TETSI|nr:hypothetical protein HHK36_009341 [Tetracentron sinense]
MVRDRITSTNGIMEFDFGLPSMHIHTRIINPSLTTPDHLACLQHQLHRLMINIYISFLAGTSLAGTSLTGTSQREVLHSSIAHSFPKLLDHPHSSPFPIFLPTNPPILQFLSSEIVPTMLVTILSAT